MANESKRVYAEHVDRYLQAGWTAVLPLPTGKKFPPPSGFTGYKGKSPTKGNYAEWRRHKADGNIALRLPPDVIVIDVDDIAAVEHLESDAGNSLPPTWKATSRNTRRGKYFYRVPRDVKWHETYKGIDIISHGHRYVNAPPSFNPDSNAYESWYDPTGNLTDVIPSPDTFPVLPNEFVNLLTYHKATDEQINLNNEKKLGWFESTVKYDQDYVKRAIKSELFAIENAPSGTRDNQLNNSVFSIGTLVAHRSAAEQFNLNDFKKRIEEACISNGLMAELNGEGPTRFNSKFEASFLAGLNNPRKAEDDFWNTRPELKYIHDLAHARLVSPWALLGAVLARVVCSINPSLVLPPIVGSAASFNLFVALVGASGDGKGIAADLAREVIDSRFGFREHQLGSGEGLVKAFADVKKNKETGKYEQFQHTKSVLFDVAEADSMFSLKHRQGSTLMPELRKAYKGEQLGFKYAAVEKAIELNSHSYRLSLILGVQPLRAKELLRDQDGGTPQRFMWMPTTDKSLKRGFPEPGTFVWQPPTLPEPMPNIDGSKKLTYVKVCPIAIDAIQQAREDRACGKGNPLDGQSLLTREKVAIALSLLNGRIDISEEDWKLSGEVMKVSDRTREHIEEELSKQTSDWNKQRGLNEAERESVKESVREQEQIQKVAKSIVKVLSNRNKVDEEGWLSSSELRRSIYIKLRDFIEPAIDALEIAGTIETTTVETNRRPGTRHRLSRGV